MKILMWEIFYMGLKVSLYYVGQQSDKMSDTPHSGLFAQKAKT